MRWRVKPIQKAVPKNSRGVRWERRQVAKKMPTMGRMVATARPVEKVRIIHWRWKAISRRRMCQKALQSAKRKKEPNSVVAAAWLTPPMAGMGKPIARAVKPIDGARTAKNRPEARGQCGGLRRGGEGELTGPRSV